MRKNSTLISTAFVPILIGIIGLSALVRKPRFALFHTVDVLQLLASGMCFGIALAAILVAVRARRAGRTQH